MKKSNNKGFSLVELIIVIAIMAVLVGLLAPQYLKYVHNSKVSTDVSNAQELATALNVAFADDVSLGSSLTAAPSGVSNITWPTLKATSGTVTANIGDNGVTTITDGTYILYPDPKAASGYYSEYHK